MTEGGGSEPAWLSRLAVQAIHLDQLREHGGRSGVRDESLLDSAVARARTRWACGEDSDLADLAAAYAHGLTRNRPFVDGNKRTALMAAYTFLGINDHDLDAPEPEAVASVVALSAGELSEEGFEAWLRTHVRPERTTSSGSHG